MPLPPLLRVQKLSTPGRPLLYLSGKAAHPDLANLYTLELTPEPRRQFQTGLRFVVRVLGRTGEPHGGFHDLKVEDALGGKGLAQHLVKAAIDSHPQCHLWIARWVVGDGLTFWPHVFDLRARPGLEFRVEPLSWE